MTNLSVIIPVFNGEETIEFTVKQMLDSISRLEPESEIIVVDDGSLDSTGQKLREIQAPRLTVVSLPRNEGKFAAIRAGVVISKGAACIFTDADLPFDLEAFGHTYGLLSRGDIDIVVGDRYLPDSYYVKCVPLKRRIASACFNFAVRLLIAGGLFDTQCGFKGFKGDVAKKLFTACGLKRFGGDVELLYLALKLNLAVRRIPVRLRRSGTTSVKLLRDGVPTLIAVISIPFRWYLGRYCRFNLESLRAKPYWYY